MHFKAVDTKQQSVVTSITRYENCVVLCSPKGVAEHNILVITDCCAETLVRGVNSFRNYGFCQT